jgi:chromodomain-helicase-DNA-binding protein 7
MDITMKGAVVINRELNKFQVLITSYEVFTSDLAILMQVPFKFVVVDEAHRLKNQ